MRAIKYLLFALLALTVAGEVDRARPANPKTRAPTVRPVSNQRWVF